MPAHYLTRRVKPALPSGAPAPPYPTVDDPVLLQKLVDEGSVILTPAQV